MKLVGAAVNVVVASLAEIIAYPIRFSRFLGYGLIITFISLIFANLYLWL